MHSWSIFVLVRDGILQNQEQREADASTPRVKINRPRISKALFLTQRDASFAKPSNIGSNIVPLSLASPSASASSTVCSTTLLRTDHTWSRTNRWKGGSNFFRAADAPITRAMGPKLCTANLRTLHFGSSARCTSSGAQKLLHMSGPSVGASCPSSFDAITFRFSSSS